MRLLIIAFVLLLFTLPMHANAQQTAWNCINLNNNLDHIAALKKSGRYRQLKSTETPPSFDYSSDTAYQDYLAFARKLIIAQNPKATLPCPINTATSTRLYGNQPLKVVDLIAPYQLDAENEKAAILLIHGLTDSPFLFNDLANYFYQQGITVRTLLLPGHGTAAQALVSSDEKEWRKSARYAILKMFEDYESVYLGGFSTGGALIIDYLNRTPLPPHQKKLKGVLLWSPASQAKSSFAWAAQYVSWFKDYLDVGADIDFAKYESFPTNAAAQVKDLMDRISIKKLKQLPDIPTLVVASEVDQTINTQSTVKLLNYWHQHKSAANQKLDTLIYYSEEALPVHPVSLTVEAAPICDDKPFCPHIIDIAHTSPTNAPQNPHYGWQGYYRNCEIHLTEKAFELCKTTDNPILGEITKENLLEWQKLQRLTFNPFYKQMTETITGFLEKTS